MYGNSLLGLDWLLRHRDDGLRRRALGRQRGNPWFPGAHQQVLYVQTGCVCCVCLCVSARV